jgi:peroxisomal 2,4-dienoyl-CoA reductase
MTAHFTGCQLNTHATVAKAGIDALSAQLAIELGPRGITSNVVAPGPIADTEGVRRLIEEADGVDIAKKIPLGRLGSVDDIANATIYLCSKAGGYVNGSMLVGMYIAKSHLPPRSNVCASRWRSLENWGREHWNRSALS